MTNAKTLLAASVGAALAALSIISATPEANAYGVITGGGYEAAPTRLRFLNIAGSSSTQILAGTSAGNANATNNSATLPFNFNLLGTAYTAGTAININTNGTITFGGGNTSGTNADLSNAAALSPSLPTLAALWSNWSTNAANSASAVYYKVTGSPGNQNLIVQWNQVVQGGKTATFQALIREAGNSIEYRYTSQDVNNANPATIGISDGLTNGQRLQWSYNTPFSTYNPPTVRFRSLNP
jgi:hypothetical protein